MTTVHGGSKVSAWDKRGWKHCCTSDKASYQLAIFGNFSSCTKLVQVRGTKMQFTRLMAKFIQIRKLTEKNEPALLSLY